MLSFEPRKANKTQQNGKRREQKSSRKKGVLQGSGKKGFADSWCSGFDEQSFGCESNRKRIQRLFWQLL